MKITKNRWLIALCAVGIHICIGSVYSWSVFSKPMINTFGWTLPQVTFAFSIAIAFLGASAAFMGKWVERHGPRRAAIISAVFFALGLLGAGFSVILKNLYLFYATYGGVMGIGLGIGYISPVSALVKWFPDRRGLATGLAIMGFGFASVIAGPAIERLISLIGIANTFFTLGVVYFCIMISSASYLALPPSGYLPPNFKKTVDHKKNIRQDLEQLTANEALKTLRFYFLWLILFINITCGIAIISVASPMAQEIAGLTPTLAAAMVGINGLFNGLGRIGWASLSDYIGRPNTYIAFFLIQIAAYFFLPHATQAYLFMLLIFIIMTCYGGGFASIPAYIGDMFGTKQLAAIHGYILTAWSLAGLTGPTIASWIHQQTHSYEKTLYIFTAFFLFALIISVLTKIEIQRLRKKFIKTNAASISGKIKVAKVKSF